MIKYLFTNTKPTEYGFEDFFGIDFSYNAAQVIEGFPDVLRHQIGREVFFQAVFHAIQGRLCADQRFIMPYIGDQSGIGMYGYLFL